MNKTLEMLEKNKDSIQDYEKLKRHLGRQIDVKIKNEDGFEDTFSFYPASYDIYTRFMALAPMVDKDEASPELAEKLLEVMVDIVKESYPTWPEEICKQFVGNNMESMMGVIDKIMPENKKDVNKLKKWQKRIDRMQALSGEEDEEGTTKPESESPQ